MPEEKPDDESKTRIFISYSREDIEAAKERLEEWNRTGSVTNSLPTFVQSLYKRSNEQWSEAEKVLKLALEAAREEVPDTEMYIELSSDFSELLLKLSKDTHLDEIELLNRGLILVGLANKVKKEGLNLVITDQDGNILSNIEGF